GGAFGQGRGQTVESCDTGAVKVERAASPGKGSTLKGTVIDPAQGAVPGASVLLTAKGSKRQHTANTSAEGAFEFASLPPGTYAVEVTAPGAGFQKLRMKQLSVGKDESVRLDLTLGLDGAMVTVGIIAIDDALTRNGNGVTVFTGKEITRLPH
ncbi:MAG TPA: carboxypeptidase-like regulatory domain-containing protein, partial [Pyrinomonadaceae bacterium]